jgi:hypothetical protein
VRRVRLDTAATLNNTRRPRARPWIASAFQRSGQAFDRAFDRAFDQAGQASWYRNRRRLTFCVVRGRCGAEGVSLRGSRFAISPLLAPYPWQHLRPSLRFHPTALWPPKRLRRPAPTAFRPLPFSTVILVRSLPFIRAR